MTAIHLKVKQLIVTQNAKRYLDISDFIVRQNRVTALIGPSGSGKTLFTKSLFHQLPPSMHIEHVAFQYHTTDMTDLKSLLGKHIGYVSQDYLYTFNDHTTLDKQLEQLYRYHKPSSKIDAQRKIQQALEWVGLGELNLKKRYRFMLSGGQLQRLAIASVMMLEPEMIIADEPTASLDVVSGARIIQLLQHLVEKHDVTLVIITHDLAHVAQLCDDLYIIDQGEIVASGPYKTFNRAHEHPLVSQLFQYRHAIQRGQVR